MPRAYFRDIPPVINTVKAAGVVVLPKAIIPVSNSSLLRVSALMTAGDTLQLEWTDGTTTILGNLLVAAADVWGKTSIAIRRGPETAVRSYQIKLLAGDTIKELLVEELGGRLT